MGQYKPDLLITFGIDELSFNKIEQISKDRLKAISDELNDTSDIKTNYTKMLNEILIAFQKSLQGVDVNLDEVVEKFADKFDYLQKMKNDFGGFAFFTSKDLDKVLKDFDKIQEKQLMLKKIKDDSYRQQQKQDTVMSMKKVEETYKFASENLEKYINDLKKFNKDKNLGIDDGILETYASLISYYKQIEAFKTNDANDRVQKTQALLTLRETMSTFENQNKELTKFLTQNTEVGITDTVNSLTKLVDSTIRTAMKSLQQETQDELDKLILKSRREATKIYELRNKGFGGEIKDYENLVEIDDVLQKYIVDIDTAKQKIDELNKSTKNMPYDKQKAQYNELMGYVQRYIDLGGKIEDLNLSGTAKRVFEKETDDYVKELKSHVTKLKNINQVIFGIGGEFGENVVEEGLGVGNGIGNGTGNGNGDGTGNGNGIGGLTEENLQALIDKLEQIKKAIDNVKVSIDSMTTDDAFKKIPDTFNEINSSFGVLKESLGDGGTFTVAINGFASAIEKIGEALEKIDSSDKIISDLKQQILDLSSALDEIRNKNENIEIVPLSTETNQVTEEILDNETKKFERLVRFALRYMQLTQELNNGGDPLFLSSKSYGKFYDFPNYIYADDMRFAKGASHRTATKTSVKRELDTYLMMSNGKDVSEKSINNALNKLSAYVYALENAEEAQKIFGKKNADLFNQVQEHIQKSVKASEIKNELDYGVSNWIKDALIDDLGINSMTYGQIDKLMKSLTNGGLDQFAEQVKELFGIEIPNAVLQSTESLNQMNEHIETAIIQTSNEKKNSIQDIYAAFKEFDDWDQKNVYKSSVFTPNVITDTEDDLNNAIDKLTEFRDKFVEFSNDDIFQELSSTRQGDVSSYIRYIENLLESTKKELEIKKQLNKYEEDETQNNENINKTNQAYEHQSIDVVPVLVEPDEPINPDSPTPINVKPILNPQEFAKEVTDQLDGVSAEINVIPKAGVSVSTTSIGNIEESVQNIDAESEKLTDLQNSIDDVTRKIGYKTAAFVNEKGEVDKVVNVEKSKLEELANVINNDVTQAINKKTDAFKEEVNTVKEAVEQEKSYLRNLAGDLDAIKDKAKIEFEFKNKIKDNEQKKDDTKTEEKKNTQAKKEYDQSFAAERAKAIEKELLTQTKDYDNQEIKYAVRKIYDEHENLVRAFIETNEVIKDETGKLIAKSDKLDISYKKSVDEDGNTIGEIATSLSTRDSVGYILQLKKEQSQAYKNQLKLEKTMYSLDQNSKEYKEVRRQKQEWEDIVDLHNDVLKSLNSEFDIEQRFVELQQENVAEYNALSRARAKYDDKLNKEINQSVDKMKKRAQDKYDKDKKDAEKQAEANLKYDADKRKQEYLLEQERKKGERQAVEEAKKQAEANLKYDIEKKKQEYLLEQERRKGNRQTSELNRKYEEKNNKINEKNRNDNIKAALKEQQSSYEKIWEIRNKLVKLPVESQGSDYENDLKNQLSIQEQIFKTKSKELKNLGVSLTDQKSLNKLDEIKNKALEERENLYRKLRVDAEKERNQEELDVQKQIQKEREELYENPYAKYQNAYDKISTKQNLSKQTDSYKDLVEQIGTKLEELKQYGGIKIFTDKQKVEINGINNEIEKMLDNLSMMYKAANQAKVSSELSRMEDYLTKNSSLYFSQVGREYVARINELQDKLKEVGLTAPELQEVVTQFNHLKVEIQQAGLAGKSLFAAIKDKAFYRTAQYIATFFSFQDIIRYTRQAINTVRELDTALVDLRKTAQMSNSELEDFYLASNSIAKQTGVTTKEIISQAAAWSRLGYSTAEQAEKMAALSSQFAAVSPDMDVSQATDGLVSSMKAFGIEVDNVERDIMDNINRIGKILPKHTVMYGYIFIY